MARSRSCWSRRRVPTSTIPAKTRDLVWARDEGRCRFPGCRATRFLELHHIVFQELGGSHDASNLLVLCDGHHKQLHEGLVAISGRAPDELVFARDGKRLNDSRAPSEQQAVAQLRQLALTPSPTARRPGLAPTTSPCARRPGLAPAPSPLARVAAGAATRFDEAVELEAAKQALRQLGYKTRDARRALAQARAHVGTGADVPTLVRAVLDMARRASQAQCAVDESTASLATQALRQAGFSATLARHAVE